VLVCKLYTSGTQSIQAACSPLPSIYNVIKGPKGPEPALGFFEKNLDYPKTNLESQVDMSMATSKRTTKVFAQRARGSRERFFSFYVIIIITSTLRFRLRYVTVAGVRFSFTLRYRSGRETHRGSRLRTLAVTSQCRISENLGAKTSVAVR
jgi:hypothetical protein